MSSASLTWRWTEAPVDRGQHHLRLVHDGYTQCVVALVAAPNDGVFPVEFLVVDDGADPVITGVLADVRRELDNYLLDFGRPDPWAYAHYHCGTGANVYSRVHWGEGEDFNGIPALDWVGGHYRPHQGELALTPLIDEAWSIHRRAAAEDGGAVVPSMPILFFGDLAGYWRSPRRVITVGLNPSNQEFPDADPWTRFPGGATLAADALDKETRALYLQELSGYFETDPYRAWFDGSFERVLNGLDASYYVGATNSVLHTDIASPVATNPTWSKLGPAREPHRGGAALWRRLADLLAPDVIIISVARKHLATVTDDEWRELTRVEREPPHRPFVVSAAEMPVNGGARHALVVFGRCTNVPFGNVRFDDREWIGTQIAAYLDQPAPSTEAS